MKIWAQTKMVKEGHMSEMATAKIGTTHIEHVALYFFNITSSAASQCRTLQKRVGIITKGIIRNLAAKYVMTEKSWDDLDKSSL
jgi:hypothetical protein